MTYIPICIYLIVSSLVENGNPAVLEETAFVTNEHIQQKVGETVLKDKFTELIKDHEVFVDKTNLIKEILEYKDKIILITRPHKWGKSTNLEMIKSFVEIQWENGTHKIVPRDKTANYRLFKHGEVVFKDGTSMKLKQPLIVAKHEKFLEENLAKYPVIHVNFKEWNGNSYDKLIQSFRHVMAGMFKSFNFLLGILQSATKDGNKNDADKEIASKNLNTFSNIIEERGSIDETKNGLFFLSKMLHEYVGSKVFVFIDDYEYPLARAIMENETKIAEEKKLKFIEFYHDFLEKSFKDNIHVEKAILTGILRLVKEDRFHNSTTIPSHGGIDNRFFHYYGFTKPEVDLMMKYIKASVNDTERIEHEYNGYDANEYNKHRIYNVWSMIHYIRSNITQDYWVNADTIYGEKLLAPVMHFHLLKGILPFRDVLESLVFEEKALIRKKDMHFHAEDFIQYRKLLYGDREKIKRDKKLSQQLSDLAISYSWAHGYLTYYLKEITVPMAYYSMQQLGLSNTCVWFRVPNYEVWHDIGRYSRFFELYLPEY